MSRGVEVTIPVYRKVDEYAHIEQRSVALLDAVRLAQEKRAFYCLAHVVFSFISLHPILAP